MLFQIQGGIFMKSIRSNIVRGKIILVSLASFGQIIGCNSNQEKPKEAGPPPAPPQVNVALTAIDDKPLEIGQKPHVGRQVMIEGTVSDPNVTICVLVHPLTTDTWWVQNLPSPPGKVGEKTWSWRTMALCGTEDLGLNEEFEIVALAESKRAVCQLGKQIKIEEFPQDLPRSEIVTVKRVN
jgi:hypothetical protein